MNIQKIIDMYVHENKSTYEIATFFNTYPNKIRRILITNKVEIKDKSAAQKNAIKNGTSKIPTQGRQRTKEERLKISTSQKKVWDNMTEAKYNAYVESAKKRWAALTEEQKTNMATLATKAIQLAGKEGSKLERFLYAELVNAGFKVEIHKKHLIPNHNLEIDLYFPDLRTIIEVDGPSHFLPIWGEEKLHKQIKADGHKTGLILGKGFIIIRIKNLSDTVSLASQEALKNRLIDMLKVIEDKFPPKSERYIEIDI